MEEEIINVPELPAEVQVVDIQFRPGQKIYYFDPNGHHCQAGDHVIIDTARGAEFGICAGGNHTIASKDVVAPLRKVIRLANAQDERIVEENRVMPLRCQTLSMRLLLRHAEYIEGMAAFLKEKALGHDAEALQKLDEFRIRFGQYEVELERYFDHFLAFRHFRQIVDAQTVLPEEAG